MSRSGYFQVGLGILRLGIITRYLSEPLIKGFTTGVACHVFTSQFPKLFGVSVQRYTGAIALIYVGAVQNIVICNVYSKDFELVVTSVNKDVYIQHLSFVVPRTHFILGG